MYEEASAINFLTKDDAPVWAMYSESKDPLPPDAAPGQGIHHPSFGQKLKEKMDALALECTIKYADDYKKNVSKDRNPTNDMVDFFKKHLKP